jgi:apolipoprotein N-acyltransferase
MSYRLEDGMLFSFAAFLGLAISTGHPAGIVAAVAMPIPCLLPRSRKLAFANALAYYAAGLWPMIPGVSRFTGHSVLHPSLLWASASLLLSVPWMLAWARSNELQYLWRVPLADIAGTLPPLGLVGFISPLTGAGYLFPGTGWAGLIATMMFPSIVLALDSSTANRRVLGGAFSAVIALGLGSQCLAPSEVKPPASWEAVNTHFGDVSRPFRDFVAARSIQQRIAASPSRVIIFPESVVPLWSDATSDFWRQTLAQCRTRGQIVAIGAGLPRKLSGPKKEAAEADLIKSYDFSAALQALRSDDDGRHSWPGPGSTTNTLAAPFDNALLVLGAESTVFYQRVPVPLGMLQPVGNGGVPLRVISPGVVTIDGQRAAVLICYEQILTYPILASMLEQPSVVVGISNMYWFADTTIPRYQTSALRAWAKLFRLPYLLAVNS